MHSERAMIGVCARWLTRRARQRIAGVTMAVVLAGLVGGCAASRAFTRAQTAANAGEWDVAIDQYRRALAADPQNPEYKVALQRAMGSASLVFAEKGRVAELRVQLD